METKYETKYSDKLDDAVLNCAVDAPLTSSFMKRRMSAFSDDPLKRRLQAAVRQECLQMSKKLLKERQAMLSTKRLSRRKQKKLEAVDRVARLASFMDISREEAQSLIDARKNAIEKESKRQEDKESRLEAMLSNVLAEVNEMKTTIEQKVIRKKMDEVLAKPTERQKIQKVTFTDQTQKLFDDLRETNTFFIHMGVVEAALQIGTATLKETANVVGLGHYRTNYIETFYDFIKKWSKSLITSLKDLLIRPAGMGFKLGKMLLSVTNPGAIPGIMWDIMKDLIFFLMGFAVIWVQFEVLAAMVVFFDLTFGTDIRSYVLIILEEYTHFCYTAFMDGLKLIPRLIGYLCFGVDAPDGSQTAVELLRSDERLFYVATALIDQLKSIVRPLINDFKNDKWIKPVIDGTSNFFGSVYQIWLWLKESAGIVVEVVIKVAKAGAGVVVDLAKAIGTKGTKLLEAGNIGEIPGMMKSSVDELTSTVWNGITGVFSSTPALEAPMLRPYTSLNVCAVLGVTKTQFDSMQNQKMVHYANNNPLSAIELIHVVYHAKNELSQSLIANPTLRF